MFVGALILELYLPQCRSLKDKRQVIKSVMDRTRQRFNVAVAEVGKNDLWQAATLGVACVSNSEGSAREMLAGVERSVRTMGKAEVIESPVIIFTP